MCGILFKTNYNTNTDKTKFAESLELLHHRGPDETGILFTDTFSFGHRRLAIRDIANGKQPMSIINKHLIYNGELYNTIELEELLLKKEVKLEYKSDTYLLLKLLETMDYKCLKELNGIFAFVYTKDNTVLAARDMFGVKPLYYTIKDGDLIIASEIKAILNLTNEAVIDKEGLCELLGMGPSHSIGKTIYKGIYELPPGCYLTYEKDKLLEIVEYYRIPTYKHTKNYEQTVKDIKEMLTNAINNQLVSDVNVSCFLSGGLDSSIISTVAAMNHEGIDTYSIDYENNKEDYKANTFEVSRDSDYTELVSKSIGSTQHNCVISNDLIVEYLTKTVDLRDTPGMTDIDSSMYFLAKEIAKKHKVSLSGECADEIFGGYPWFYKDNQTEGFPWITNISFRQNLLNENLRDKINLEEYVTKEYEYAKSITPLSKKDNPKTKKERIMSFLNIRYFMTNLLDRKDRMTMGTSLEVRVPFCDKDLVGYLYNVPFKYKYRSKTEKKLLRDAFKGIVVNDVINRKKSPYPKSNSHIYEEKVTELFSNLLEDKESIIHQIFDDNALKELINNKEFDKPWYGQLMRKTALMAYIYQIDYWFKKYNVRMEI